MAFLSINYKKIKDQLSKCNVTLIAVSKTKSVEEILEAYSNGQRDFGENYVQELIKKQEVLPKDIRWHFIGHLQTNKVKDIIRFVHLVQGVDSKKLLQEINKQGKKIGIVVNCLLQMHIAKEETKFGLDETELESIFNAMDSFTNVRICGLMGMATFSSDRDLITNEFQYLRHIFNTYKNKKAPHWQFDILSMGMSSDYTIAIGQNSNMVRIGSLLFGERKKYNNDL